MSTAALLLSVATLTMGSAPAANDCQKPAAQCAEAEDSSEHTVLDETQAWAIGVGVGGAVVGGLGGGLAGGVVFGLVGAVGGLTFGAASGFLAAADYASANHLTTGLQAGYGIIIMLTGFIAGAVLGLVAGGAIGLTSGVIGGAIGGGVGGGALGYGITALVME